MKRKKKVAKKKPKKGLTLRASIEVKRSGPMSEVGLLYSPIKKPVTIRVDADVLAWFKKKGRGYQTRMNRALRRAMMEER